jgi:hypothetical protein
LASRLPSDEDEEAEEEDSSSIRVFLRAPVIILP